MQNNVFPEYFQKALFESHDQNIKLANEINLNKLLDTIGIFKTMVQSKITNCKSIFHLE